MNKETNQQNGTGQPSSPATTSTRRALRAASLCLLAFAGSLHLAHACTPVLGDVNGETWTAANSPYCVIGDVRVLGDGLTIKKGVTVRFDGNYEFLVTGKIQVNGTIEAPVLFTPQNSTNCWKGIAFVDARPGSYFNHAIIEGACQSGVRITNTPPAFINCIIRNNSSPAHGGGILAKVGGQPLVMEWCTISNNAAAPQNTSSQILGGGIFTEGSLLLLQSTVVSNRTGGNSLSFGGGVFARWGDCTMRNCIIAQNVSVNGRGAYFWGAVTGRLYMANCLIAANGIKGVPAPHAGGGLYVYVSSPATLLNCVVADNSSDGLRFDYGSSISSVINCTVVSNEVYGIVGYNGGSARVTNSIVYFNDTRDNYASQFYGSRTVRYSDVQLLAGEPGEGNINNDPGLCTNYSLMQGSPCIDAGSTNFVYNEVCTNDATCTPYSRGTATNDMGAYGGPGACYGVGNVWPEEAPSIVAQPQDQKVCLNLPATFSAAATGDHPLSYRWYFNMITPLANETNASLTITSVQHANAGWYHVVVSNAYGSRPSEAAELEVPDQTAVPWIVTQPSDQKGSLGGSAALTVLANGCEPLSYQWYFNTNTLLTNASSPSLNLTNLQYSNAGLYHLVVWNPWGITTSAPARLSIYDATVDIQLRDYFGFMYAGLNIGAQPGTNCELRYTTDLDNNNFSTWTLLERKAMTNWTWFYFDMSSPYSPQRFYGARLVP